MSIRARDGVPTVIAAVGGVALVAIGLWAFASPRTFFDAFAPFEPYNAHLLRDIGAFQIGLGAVLLLAVRLRDGLLVALTGVGVGSGVHVVGHVIDRHAGGRPALDIPLLAVLTVALLAGAAVRVRAGRATRGDASRPPSASS